MWLFVAGPALQQRRGPEDRLQDQLHPVHANLQLRGGGDRRGSNNKQDERLSGVYSSRRRSFPAILDFLRDRNTKRPTLRGVSVGVQAESGEAIDKNGSIKSKSSQMIAPPPAQFI